jgi:hypothetical protein
MEFDPRTNCSTCGTENEPEDKNCWQCQAFLGRRNPTICTCHSCPVHGRGLKRYRHRRNVVDPELLLAFRGRHFGRRWNPDRCISIPTQQITDALRNSRGEEQAQVIEVAKGLCPENISDRDWSKLEFELENITAQTLRRWNPRSPNALLARQALRKLRAERKRAREMGIGRYF